MRSTKLSKSKGRKWQSPGNFCTRANGGHVSVSVGGQSIGIGGSDASTSTRRIVISSSKKIGSASQKEDSSASGDLPNSVSMYVPSAAASAAHTESYSVPATHLRTPLICISIAFMHRPLLVWQAVDKPIQVCRWIIAGCPLDQRFNRPLLIGNPRCDGRGGSDGAVAVYEVVGREV